MCAARLVAQLRAKHNGARQFEHVFQLPCEGEARIRPLAPVGKVHLLIAVQQLHNLLVSFLQPLVVANHGRMLGHRRAQFPPKLEWIFRPFVLQ